MHPQLNCSQFLYNGSHRNDSPRLSVYKLEQQDVDYSCSSPKLKWQQVSLIFKFLDVLEEALNCLFCLTNTPKTNDVQLVITDMNVLSILLGK